MATLTKAGKADIATASFEHIQVFWSTFVIGDANGISYVPSEEQTSIVHEVYRGEISGYQVIDEVTGLFEIVLPADVGSFMVREIGILNEDNELVAVDCFAQNEAQPKIKHDVSSTARYNDLVIKFHVHIDNANAVKVMVDPYAAVASRGYVDEQMKRFKESEDEDIDRIFEMASSDPGGYPEDWEEATFDDIDAFFTI